MLKRQNGDIRKMIKEAGLKQWQVAELYGLTESSFSKLLRYTLSEEKRSCITTAIKRLKGE